MSDILRFQTLLGSGNLDFAITCLGSFLALSETPVALDIYGDGSLGPDHCALLKKHLPGTRIIHLMEREATIQEKLANYPNCQKFRSKNVYAQKLFDVMLFESGPVRFIDSDVLFLRRFRLPEFKETPIFMMDKQNAFSFDHLEFYKIHLPIYPRVNSGLFYFPDSKFDLDYLESLFTHPVISKGVYRSVWIEQTLWAFLAGKYSKFCYFHPRQIIMSSHKLHLTPRTVAVHLVSSYRYHFAKLTQLNLAQEKSEDLILKTTHNPLGNNSFLLDRIKKTVKRRIGIK